MRQQAVEDLDITHGRHLLVGQTPAEFADHVVQVLDRSELAASLRDGALQLLHERYTPEAMLPVVRSAIDALMEPAGDRA